MQPADRDGGNVGRSAPLRVAVTGPGNTDVLNCLVGDPLFPVGSEKVAMELHWGPRAQLRVFRTADASPGPWMVADLGDCPAFKVLRRAAYLQHTFDSLADVAIHPAAHRLELHYPFASPFGDCPVVLTNAEDTAGADVVFSTAPAPGSGEGGGPEDVTLFSPTGICRGLRPRHALLSGLCGEESDSAKYFRTAIARVLEKAVRQAWAKRGADAATSRSP
eukprot:EG_transcript_20450